jgi:hypothetical protein
MLTTTWPGAWRQAPIGYRIMWLLLAWHGNSLKRQHVGRAIEPRSRDGFGEDATVEAEISEPTPL